MAREHTATSGDNLNGAAVMTSDQWAEVKRVFAEAINLESARRGAYLARACRSQEFRRQVNLLLAQHDKAQGFPGVYSSVGNRTLGHYEIFEQIGEGGMAIVYKARDTRLDRWIALKILQPWTRGSPAAQERLMAEARAASRFNHPNIVTVHEVVHSEDVYFIVMEYVHGQTLDRWISPEGMPIPDAISCALQVADALSAAHDAGILHGDLKPANIMITETARIKLLDFGLAKALRMHGSQTDFFREANALGQFGTKAYMAPEQLQNSNATPDPRSDIFSFGLVLYQMLTGRHPFGRGPRERPAEAIRTGSPASLPARVPASLARVVQRCLEKDPQGRFQSMRDVYVALTNCGEAKRSRGAPLKRSASFTTSDVEEIVGTIERIGFQNIPKSRQALRELAHALKKNSSDHVHQTAILALRDFIQADIEFEGNVIPAAIRQLRKEAFDVIKIATQGHLRRCFGPRDLEHLDLYGVNLAAERLTHFSFRQCFLVEANFRGSHVNRASFAEAHLRNTNFASADLSGADLTGADWFNALHLTEVQVKSVRKSTLMRCPADIPEMHEYLANHYVVPFGSWSPHVQEQLKAAWNRYLRPKGLREVVDSWQK